MINFFDFEILPKIDLPRKDAPHLGIRFCRRFKTLSNYCVRSVFQIFFVLMFGLTGSWGQATSNCHDNYDLVGQYDSPEEVLAAIKVLRQLPYHAASEVEVCKGKDISLDYFLGQPIAGPGGTTYWPFIEDVTQGFCENLHLVRTASTSGDSGWFAQCSGPSAVLIITLTGPSSTKSLPAGPALPQTATITKSGTPAAGKSVSISIASGGSVGGTTDGNGQFAFTYVPPYKKTTDQLTASCQECSNTAQKSITVEPCDVCEGKKGNPISTATGEKEQTEPDWQDSAAHPLPLIRNYRSFANLDAGLGARWSHNWAATVTKEDLQATVRFGDGNKVLFKRDTLASLWIADNRKDSLNDSASGTTYTRASDESRWLFNGSGKLATITQRNGWTMTLAYNASNQLTSVTNVFGRALQFAYDSAGRLITVTTPDARQISYAFDSASRLIGVVYPGNTSRSYAYEDARWSNALTSITDENGVRYASFAYDNMGRAISTQHAGNAQTYNVNYGSASGAAVGSVIAGGRVDPSIYQSTSQVTDPLGNLQRYNWQGGDGNVRLASTNGTFEGGQIASRSFGQGSTLPESETDFLGVLTTYSWDTSRQLPLSTTAAAGRPEAQTLGTQWHPTWRLPVLITEQGRSTTYSYDALGNKLTEAVTDNVTGQTRTWAWTYNAQGLVATSTDPLGGISQYAYDAAGNLSSVKNPLGQETKYTFDGGAGRVLSQTEPSGLLTSYAYDLRGRVLQITRGTELTALSYIPSGQLSSLSLPNGYAVSYSYDAAQRLIAASDNRGNSIQYTLDPMGNRVREEVRDASGTLAQVTARTINSLNRVAALSGSTGQTTQYGYDANGEPVSQTDPLNQSTRQSLDGLRRPIATTFADNASATQAWNGLNQLSSVTDPKGIPTRYQTNAWGEVTLETSPDIGQLSYQRDANGNITASTDAKGQSTKIERDALGRPSQITLNDGKTQQFSFDATGNLSQILDASGSTSYSRDSLGRILQKTQSVADNLANPSGYSTSYQYHSGSTPAQVSYPSGLNVFYRKNAAGQISQIDVQEPGKKQPITPFVTGLAYTALNQPKVWSWTGGDSGSRNFDADGRMLGNEIASYQFDAAGRITSLTQNLWALQDAIPATASTPASAARFFAAPITWTAGYDARDRLTSFSRPAASSSFSYDANSNRLSAINKTTSDTDLDGDFDQSDLTKTNNQALTVAPDSNRLLGFSQTLSTSRTNAKGKPVVTSSTQVNYTLDANGNLTSDGLRTFDYDAADRLSQVQIGNGLEASQISYLHNAQGLRVFKSEPQVAQTAPNEAALGADFTAWLKKNFGWLFAQAQQNATLGQSYVYDDAVLGTTPNLLGEYGNGGAKSAGRMEYIWLPTESGQAIPIGLYRNNRFYAIHSDHLGTPRLITDDNNKPVWQWAYSGFGDNKPTGVLKATTNPKAALTNVPTLLKATSPAITVNLRFPGQYADEESNLFENGFRSYRPGMGSYTQSDPIGLRGGLNPFSYVGGNPLSFVDPLGLEKVILVPMREGWTFAAALTYPDNDGLLTIISHGSTTSVNMKTPTQLAALIKNLPSWKAGDQRPVLLNACNTGVGGDDSYAAKLSKELGVPVTAPTTQTWNIGPIDIGPFNANSAGDAPNLLKPGSWVTFKK